MTAHYTYLATDLVTNTVLGELPVNNVSLDCQLNQPGNMSAGGKLSDPRILDNDFIARTVPGRTAFWAYRENTIVWGGAILTRTYESEGKSLTFTGQTFECYAGRRFPASIYGNASKTLNLGQAATIDALWQILQSIPGGYIGVLPATLPSVDPVTTLIINGYDKSTSFLDLINSITALTSGPDWTIGWTEDGQGLPQKQLLVGTPIGNPVNATDLVYDYPGGAIEYTYTESASSGNNSWWAIGNGSGTTTTTGVATDPNYQSNGYPLWEGVNNYSGVTSQSTINAHATSDLATFPVPYITHSSSLKGDVQPVFGTYGLGDHVVEYVTDSRFPAGNMFSQRIIGWTIQPPDEGQGTEMITPVYYVPAAGT